MSDDEFDEDYFDRLSRARTHWWVVGMLDVGRRLLGPVDPPARVLDAGCGTGANFAWLHEIGASSITAIDFSRDAVRFCRRDVPRDVELAQASVTHVPCASSSFDLVVSSDVLQHLTESDAATALAEVHRVLRPGGRFLVRTNAAFGRAHLAEREDWRLYQPEILRAELEESGLTVERLSYANSLPALASVVRNTVARRRPGHHDHDDGHAHDHDDHDHDHPEEAGIGIPTDDGRDLRSRILGATLRLEGRWLARPRASLPFGHALVAVARRPD